MEIIAFLKLTFIEYSWMSTCQNSYASQPGWFCVASGKTWQCHEVWVSKGNRIQLHQFQNYIRSDSSFIVEPQPIRQSDSLWFIYGMAFLLQWRRYNRSVLLTLSFSDKPITTKDDQLASWRWTLLGWSLVRWNIARLPRQEKVAWIWLHIHIHRFFLTLSGKKSEYVSVPCLSIVGGVCHHAQYGLTICSCVLNV